MKKTFSEFVSHKDGVIHQPGDITELLQRIVTEHGARLRQMIRSAISGGEVDDDKSFKGDLQELSKALASSSPNDQFPIRSRGNKEPDVVTRPSADGGGAVGDGGGGGGGGGD